MSDAHLTKSNQSRILIVGAGIAGLTLARQLAQKGKLVTVLEKSPGVGGRLATRRGSGCVWDHGLADLKPEDVPPENYLDWKKLGVLEKRLDQKKLAWICPQGITQLPKAMEAICPVVRNVKIESIRVNAGGKLWLLGDQLGHWHHGSQLVLAIPAPQALQLLEGSFPHQMVSLKESLSRIQYRPALVILAKAVRKKGASLTLKAESPIESIVDNGKKGVHNSEGAVTLYLNDKYSLKHFDSPEEQVIQEIKALVVRKMGTELSQLSLKRWRYAQVHSPSDEPFLSASLTSPLYVIGDGFHGGGLKGALLSANALAERLLRPQPDKKKTEMKIWRAYGNRSFSFHSSR